MSPLLPRPDGVAGKFKTVEGKLEFFPAPDLSPL
jgi:hypothetical protein